MAGEAAALVSPRQSMDDWIERALGFRLPTAASAGAEEKPIFSAMGLGRARQQWIAARQEAAEQVARLRDALTLMFEDDADQRTTLNQAHQKLESIIRAFDVTLETEAEALLGEEDPAVQRTRIQSLLSICAALKAMIESDPVVAELDGNEIVPEMVIVAPVLRTLDEIRAAISQG